MTQQEILLQSLIGHILAELKYSKRIPKTIVNMWEEVCENPSPEIADMVKKMRQQANKMTPQ